MYTQRCNIGITSVVGNVYLCYINAYKRDLFHPIVYAVKRSRENETLIIQLTTGKSKIDYGKAMKLRGNFRDYIDAGQGR